MAERSGDDRLVRALRAVVGGEVSFATADRALMTMDASNYRRVPAGVVAPRDADDVAAALAVCREHGVPVVPRGGGTSIAGQATGTGVVLDFTRHMNRVLAVDPDARTAVVQPGVVLDRLRAAVGVYGLTFGPDPSTHSRCTLGGMIGNNACGAHSVAWGTTADNVVELRALGYGGERLRLSRGLDGLPSRLRDGLRSLTDDHLALLRTGFPDLPRRISGYALDALLPERGRDVARAFCGSEGTWGVLTEAVVRLVDEPRARALVVLGYPDEGTAADAAPTVLPYRPLTVEGMAADLMGDARGLLPQGEAWLFVEVGGDSPAEARAAAERLVHACAGDTVAGLGTAGGGRGGFTVVTEPARQRALWRLREDAAGTATRIRAGTSSAGPGGDTEAWPGWEDCAVPPARLGAYLRDFRALLAEHGLHGAPYGHFGEGCVHVRIDFDLLGPEGVSRYRAFSGEVADLVVAHGGSLSGEHGDGMARAELLPRMYGEPMVRLFERAKDLWDPADGLNPGVLVRPRPLDENLRFAVLPKGPVEVAFGYPDDGGDFTAAVRRCVGVAKCRTGTTGGAEVMCPSYRVTGEERHSTRGRARLLHEMLAGEVIEDGWRSEEVREALDLCLSCKGCRSDCPVGVDMATYKAEFLHHYYRDRARPASHLVLGRLPVWLRAVAAVRAAPLVNGLARVKPLAALGKRLAGVTPERAVPELAREPFTRWWQARGGNRASGPPADEVRAGVGAGASGRPADGGRVRGGGVRRRPAPGSRRAGRRGGGRPAAYRRALAGHLHQPPLAGGRPVGRGGAGGRRTAGGGTAPPGVLRAHLDLHRPAGRGPHGPAAHPGRAGARARRRTAGGRPGTQLHRGAPHRPARAARRRPQGGPARRGGAHLRRGAGGVRAALAAPAAGPPGSRPDPLPPARRPR
ncbi:FAD-binding and (Fe-S)-binding domain-containing protein [Streptomyces pactum]|uniref:FAD-binding and (Fe-S)-binding domain-containing protein n=1 Tax=Streptomyces pactum TaxID=68249 RepID=UPI001E6292D0|nr:FAD-binding and (Fe-S)-binding domain-containing protein [Streptomyces pactum]